MPSEVLAAPQAQRAIKALADLAVDFAMDISKLEHALRDLRNEAEEAALILEGYSDQKAANHLRRAIKVANDALNREAA